jgi:hypothetical protein
VLDILIHINASLTAIHLIIFTLIAQCGFKKAAIFAMIASAVSFVAGCIAAFGMIIISGILTAIVVVLTTLLVASWFTGWLFN